MAAPKANDEASKPTTRYLTMSQLRQQIIDWTDDTIRNKIKNEGFPAIRDGRGYLFDRKEVELWFKRRTVHAG